MSFQEQTGILSMGPPPGARSAHREDFWGLSTGPNIPLPVAECDTAPSSSAEDPVRCNEFIHPTRNARPSLFRGHTLTSEHPRSPQPWGSPLQGQYQDHERVSWEL